MNKSVRSSVVIMFAGIALMAASCAKTQTNQTTGLQSQATSGQSVTPAPAAAGMTTVTVVGKNFSFSPSEIKVKKGDKVRLVFQNSDGFHDFVIDDFNVRTKTIKGGESDTVEFTADKTGSFEYYCSVGQHRQMGMKGTLIVE